MTEAKVGRRGTWALYLAALVGAVALALALAGSANAGAAPAVDCSKPDPGDGCATVDIVIVGSGSGRVVEFNDASGTLHDTSLDCRTGDVGVCAEEVPIDTHVGLRALPDAGSEFIGWSVAGDAHFFGCGQEATCYPAANGEGTITVIAEFDEVAEVPLTVVRAGTAAGSGFVSSSPAGIYCGLDCTDSYPENSQVTLTAVVPTGVTFAWGGDCAASGTSPTCVLSMTGVKSVIANFNTITYPLSLAVVGGGSVVASSAAQPDIHCPEVLCTANFPQGSQVTVTPDPDPGWEFAGWSGACTGTTACVVTMTQARSVTATFVLGEVQAHVASHKIVYLANNLRQLRVKVDAGETVSVLMQIRRNGVTLQQKPPAVVVGPDVRELRMTISQSIGGGQATLRVTFTNEAGTKKVANHTIKIPKPKQVG
jgi:hypothetical protein